ncbi:MAG TPA: hypothetical protein VNH22_00980 [Blastocatellia bacterium]|jgi:hypothetical protein|nr:hypothetical protein [Blastocatellia bacterium]
MEKRKDDRDANKAEDEGLNDEVDESQQAAELQVGEDDEAANPSRYKPDK